MFKAAGGGVGTWSNINRYLGKDHSSGEEQLVVINMRKQD